jgi:hypothetical protein
MGSNVDSDRKQQRTFEAEEFEELGIEDTIPITVKNEEKKEKPVRECIHTILRS